MNIALQSTSKVTLKSLIFPSPYAMFKCSSSVEEGKEKLYWNLVVPKSYLLEGQPKSTRNEYPILSAFGNSRQIQYGDL